MGLNGYSVQLGVVGEAAGKEVKTMPQLVENGGTKSREDQLEDGRKALRLIREEGWRIAGAARFFGVSIPVIHEAAQCESGARCNGFGCRIRGPARE